jgi:hypothetical protein
MQRRVYLALRISGFERRAIDKVLGFPLTAWVMSGYPKIHRAKYWHRVTVLFGLDPQDWLLPEAVFIDKLREWRRAYVIARIERGQ